ncbi:DUF4348 domain-containing protein [Emticicia sp. BO119]|uniref:DUF4348 domain-containing protein n=1 Tax=Emticicia sp. BO119 TaxID=2757768 RepID=UPI0015F0CED8|nr:DUF4348 domain-containing protein [Emticicia sp. BO119]MBA4849289.1 DUF4348 domain-containing protein [Emticicia sp. BO119]
MKLIAFLLFLAPFFNESYAKKEIGLVEEIENNEDDFDKFFKEFCRNSTFQLSRIKFPLKVVVVDDEKRNEKMIQQNDWRHTNLQKLKREHPKNRLETVDKGTDSKDVVFTNKESGEVVHHLFSKIDNQWYLTSIIDESE